MLENPPLNFRQCFNLRPEPRPGSESSIADWRSKTPCALIRQKSVGRRWLKFFLGRLNIPKGMRVKSSNARLLERTRALTDPPKAIRCCSISINKSLTTTPFVMYRPSEIYRTFLRENPCNDLVEYKCSFQN